MLTQTQLIVLVVTLLLTSLVVVPLMVIAFKKEKKRKEEEVQKIKRSIAREEAKARAAEEEAKSDALRKENVRLIEEYQKVKQPFRELIRELYSSDSCLKCSSNVVKLVKFDYESGVMHLACGKCGSVRTVAPANPKAFTDLIPQLTPPMQAYQSAYALAPDLPDLLFSI